MKLDVTEKKILELLYEDPRLSLRKLAEKCDVTTPTISNKIKRLENMDIIKGYSVNIDYSKLGLNEYIFKLDVPPKSTNSIAKNLKEKKNVVEIFEIDGRYILLKLLVSNTRHLDDFLIDLKTIPDIQDFTFFRTTNTYLRFKQPPINDSNEIEIGCYYCHKPIEGDPVKLKLDDKEHYLCCETCAEMYEEKYKKLKEKS
ncbi:MAG: winged helix-turn-helix transcriptional regulator [Thermoplasmatota archaeon]